MTGGTLFRIETVNPYPTDYNECTEVAREELDNGVRPELSSTVDNLDDYDVVFVGCPVWWHTAPMAVCRFSKVRNMIFRTRLLFRSVLTLRLIGRKRLPKSWSLPPVPDICRDSERPEEIQAKWRVGCERFISYDNPLAILLKTVKLAVVIGTIASLFRIYDYFCI